MITLGSVLAIVFVFGSMVFVHELGHFLTMKHFGVEVKQFSIGFVPILRKKWRGTEYCIGCLPLGGYVMPADEKYSEKLTFGQSTIIFLSGMIMNVFFASLILLFLANAFGMGPIKLYQMIGWGTGPLMVRLVYPVILPVLGWLLNIPFSIYLLLTQNIPASQAVGGPIMIGKIIADAYALGFTQLLTIAAILNIAIASMNLIPIPQLDGGQIIVDLIKKKIPKLIFLIPYMQYLGYALLLLLIVFVFANDIINVFLK